MMVQQPRRLTSQPTGMDCRSLIWRGLGAVWLRTRFGEKNSEAAQVKAPNHLGYVR